MAMLIPIPILTMPATARNSRTLSTSEFEGEMTRM